MTEPGDPIPPPITEPRAAESEPAGRPRSNSRRRTAMVCVRFTPEEHADLLQRAGEWPVSTWLRAVGLRARMTRRQRRRGANSAKLAELLGHFGRAGSNVNQIARRLNERREVVPLPEIRAAVNALQAAARVIYDQLGRDVGQDEAP